MRRSFRWITSHARTLTLAAGVLTAPAALAQQPPAGDLLDQTRRMQSIAAQQMEAEVRLGLADASRLATSDRAKAVEKYKQLLTQLQSDKALPEDRRTTLVRQVQDRLRVAEANAATDEAAARKAQDEATRQLAAGQQAAEQVKIKKGIDAVAALRKDGKVADAQRQAQELLKNYPEHVAVRVLNGISTSVDAINSERAVRQEKEQGLVANARDIERSAIPLTGDIEFPKDWKEKTDRRLKGTPATQAEMKMLQALAKPISAEFKTVKLQDAMQTISTAMDRTIIIDPTALQENGITYEMPVTLNARTLAARTVLRHLLSQVGLTYVIRDDVINVTTPGRARDMMVTKSYYIGDIVSGVGLFGGGAQWGPALDQVQLAQNVNAVIEMIMTSVDPMSWNHKGGFGSIGFNVPTMSLIVRQSAEVHAMIGNGLLR